MRITKSADLEQLQFAAASFKKTQHYALAEDAYRQLIQLEEAMFGPETSAIALGLYNLAEVVVHQQKYDEARNLLRRAVEIWEKAHPSDYLSLMSYTEAVSSVKRHSERLAAAAQPDTRSAVQFGATVVTNAAQNRAAIGNVTVAASANVIQMRRLVNGSTHVA